MQKIPQGQRSMKLRDKAFDLYHEEMSLDKIAPVLRVMNQQRCDPPLSDAKIERVIKLFTHEVERNELKAQAVING